MADFMMVQDPPQYAQDLICHGKVIVIGYSVTPDFTCICPTRYDFDAKVRRSLLDYSFFGTPINADLNNHTARLGTSRV